MEKIKAVVFGAVELGYRELMKPIAVLSNLAEQISTSRVGIICLESYVHIVLLEQKATDGHLNKKMI